MPPPPSPPSLAHPVSDVNRSNSSDDPLPRNDTHGMQPNDQYIKEDAADNTKDEVSSIHGSNLTADVHHSNHSHQSFSNENRATTNVTFVSDTDTTNGPSLGGVVKPHDTTATATAATLAPPPPPHHHHPPPPPPMPTQTNTPTANTMHEKQPPVQGGGGSLTLDNFYIRMSKKGIYVA